MNTLLEQLHGVGVIPVIALENAEDAIPLCSALAEGGLPVAEITFRTASAAAAIAKVRKAMPDILAGAGTVTSVELAQKAYDAGALFAVTPGYNPEVVRWCLDHSFPVIPGCTTASEVEAAQNAGLRTVKFFPAEQSGGLARLQALSGPYPEIRFIPTGGIGLQNIEQYLGSRKVVACGGSFMVAGKDIAARNWAQITALSKEAVSAAMGLRFEGITISPGSRELATEWAGDMARLFDEEPEKRGTALHAGGPLAFTPEGISGMHIHYSVLSLARARYQLQRKGMKYTASSDAFHMGKEALHVVSEKEGGLSIYLTERQH